jgi:hypothetical protein
MDGKLTTTTTTTTKTTTTTTMDRGSLRIILSIWLGLIVGLIVVYILYRYTQIYSPFKTIVRENTERLQTGDLLLFSNYKSPNLGNNLKKFFIQLYSGSEWTHVGLVFRVGHHVLVWETTPQGTNLNADKNRFSPHDNPYCGFSKLEDVIQYHRGYLGFKPLLRHKIQNPETFNHQLIQNCLVVDKYNSYHWSITCKLWNGIILQELLHECENRLYLSCYESIILIFNMTGIPLFENHRGVLFSDLINNTTYFGPCCLV